MSAQGERGHVGEPPVSLSQTRTGGPGDQKPWRALGASTGQRALEGTVEGQPPLCLRNRLRSLRTDGSVGGPGG
jgi:hypothetical protein